MASHGVPRVSASLLDKSEAAKEKERRQIEQYKTLEKDVLDRIAAQDFSNDTFQLLSALLQQNPEYYTIWNHRRRLLSDIFARELSSGNSAVIENPPTEADSSNAAKAGLTLAQQEIKLLIEEDLSFLIPLLRGFPKCYWIWNHRSWLLATATKHLPSEHVVKLWHGELALVGKMLSLDSRNFHGWGYRRTAVAAIEELSGQSMCKAEFEYTNKMVNSNLSNFSAWHNRSKLIPRLLAERNADQGARRKMLDDELQLITRALYTDPYDQSLWFYHQYLMATLDQSNLAAPAILQPCGNADRLHYLDQEIDSVKDMLEDADDCKYIYQALLEYSVQYFNLEAGNKKVTTVEMRAWLEELRKLDPLREGRWRDLADKLQL